MRIDALESIAADMLKSTMVGGTQTYNHAKVVCTGDIHKWAEGVAILEAELEATKSEEAAAYDKIERLCYELRGLLAIEQAVKQWRDTRMGRGLRWVVLPKWL